MAVILWVGVRSRKAMANKAADPEFHSDQEHQVSPSMKSTFESLFEEFSDQSVSEAFDEEEFEQEQPVSDSEQEAAFVAFEDEVLSQDSAPDTSAGYVDEDSSDEESESFNLRQAVIYQTILNNKYLSEVHSFDN